MTRRPSGSLAAALVAIVVTIAACNDGSSGHRTRGTHATSTSTSTASSVTTTTTVRPPSTTAPASNGAIPPTGRPGAVPSPQANCIAETPPEMARYLGLSLHDAEALAASQGYHVRVVGADGTCKLVTQELDPRRVDLYLDHGVVTAAGMG